MKKRNEEGYVLVYVMVVVFVLCAIALALMSGTLRTLQMQETMVRRMQDKYQAMGEIERVVAELDILVPLDSSTGNKLSGQNNDSESDAFDDGCEALVSYLTSENSPFKFDAVQFFNDPSNKHYGTLSLTFSAHQGSTSISSEIFIKPDINVIHSAHWIEDHSPEDNIPENGPFTEHPEYWTYEISGMDYYCFESYEVTSIGGVT